MNCFVISSQKMQPEISRKPFPAKKSRYSSGSNSYSSCSFKCYKEALTKNEFPDILRIDKEMLK